MGKKQRGFSLIEMITVIAIIGILTTIAVPQINKYIDKANETKIYSALSQLNNTAILMYTSSEYEEVKIETIIQELGKENLVLNQMVILSHFKLVVILVILELKKESCC